MKHFISFKQTDGKPSPLLIGPYTVKEIAEREGANEASRLSKAYGKPMNYEIIDVPAARKEVPA